MAMILTGKYHWSYRRTYEIVSTDWNRNQADCMRSRTAAWYDGPLLACCRWDDCRCVGSGRQPAQAYRGPVHAARSVPSAGE